MAVGRVVDVSVRMLYVLELKVRVLQGGAELATVVGIPDTNNGWPNQSHYFVCPPPTVKTFFWPEERVAA
jgi:hypothetical protein